MPLALVTLRQACFSNSFFAPFSKLPRAGWQPAVPGRSQTRQRASGAAPLWTTQRIDLAPLCGAILLRMIAAFAAGGDAPWAVNYSRTYRHYSVSLVDPASQDHCAVICSRPKVPNGDDVRPARRFSAGTKCQYFQSPRRGRRRVNLNMLSLMQMPFPLDNFFVSSLPRR